MPSHYFYSKPNAPHVYKTQYATCVDIKISFLSMPALGGEEWEMKIWEEKLNDAEKWKKDFSCFE